MTSQQHQPPLCDNIKTQGLSIGLAQPYRGVAQLIARMVRDHEVVGLNPTTSTNDATAQVSTHKNHHTQRKK